MMERVQITLRDEHGNETVFTPEEWDRREILNRLAAIEAKLDLLLSSIHPGKVAARGAGGFANSSVTFGGGGGGPA
jgi:hypothetical protein